MFSTKSNTYIHILLICLFKCKNLFLKLNSTLKSVSSSNFIQTRFVSFTYKFFQLKVRLLCLLPSTTYFIMYIYMHFQSLWYIYIHLIFGICLFYICNPMKNLNIRHLIVSLYMKKIYTQLSNLYKCDIVQWTKYIYIHVHQILIGFSCLHLSGVLFVFTYLYNFNNITIHLM